MDVLKGLITFFEYHIQGLMPFELVHLKLSSKVFGTLLSVMDKENNSIENVTTLKKNNRNTHAVIHRFRPLTNPNFLQFRPLTNPISTTPSLCPAEQNPHSTAPSTK